MAKDIGINKSIYRAIREDELGISRERASELLGGISPERIEKIENGKVIVQPDDVVSMAKGYDRPELCNYYCLNECRIGEIFGRTVKVQDLTHIAVDAINAFNRIEKERDRLLEIVEDDVITSDEYEDFTTIRNYLEKIASAADSLKIWAEKTNIDKELGK